MDTDNQLTLTMSLEIDLKIKLFMLGDQKPRNISTE